MTNYVSRRYLREKYDRFKRAMEIGLKVYDLDDEVEDELFEKYAYDIVDLGLSMLQEVTGRSFKEID